MLYEGYDCVIEKPEMDDIFIAHYGVKGMKWRKHLKRAVNKLSSKTIGKIRLSKNKKNNE